MNMVRLANPVKPSCDAWKATCSAISQRSMAIADHAGQVVELS